VFLMFVTKNEPPKVCLTFWLLGILHGVYETAALGRVVLLRR